MSSPPDHTHYLLLALAEARKSPPRPTNFCVGAVLVSPSSTTPSPTGHPDPRVLAAGYTLECAGNTHAEQCCFIKLARAWGLSGGERAEEEALGERLPRDAVLYTTMEPCNRRSVGNRTCVERILGLRGTEGGMGIRTVVCGVLEPDTFVGVNEGRKRLEDGGVEVVHVRGLEDEILKVATAGHRRRQAEYMELSL